MSTPETPAQLLFALAGLRANKAALYLLAGALGGAMGAVLAEFTPAGQRQASALATMLTTGVWLGVASGVLALALFAAGEWHQRRELRPRRASGVLLLGALAGFVAGVVAQAAFTVQIGSDNFQNYVVRTFCWALMGALLGALLSRPVPNLGWLRGLAAGFVGGGLGGVGFIFVGHIIADALGRLVGLGTLSLALGLAMLVVEKLFREASLEVIWAPQETTQFNLGAQPVTIGGGEDQSSCAACHRASRASCSPTALSNTSRLRAVRARR